MKKKNILIGIITCVLTVLVVLAIVFGNMTTLKTSADVETDQIVFTVPGGAYEDLVEVTLETVNHCDIYYTLDGSDPMLYGTEYEGPITIDRSDSEEPQAGAPAAVTVQAVTKDHKTQAYGRIYVSTYFIGTEYATCNLPVFSIQVEEEQLLSETGIYQTVMQDVTASKEKISAYIEFFDAQGMKQNEEYVQMSMHGTGSLAFDMKSFRLYFKKKVIEGVEYNPVSFDYDLFMGNATNQNNEAITSYQRIILRNGGNDCSGSMLRDVLAARICSHLNLDVMAGQPTLVYINGEFFGLYNARERYDSKYFAEHYGVEEENVVMLETPSPLTSGTTYAPYELSEGTDGDDQDFLNVVEYCTTHDLSEKENYDYVCSQIDTASLIDLVCANLFLGNMDWPQNNVRVWRNKNEADISGMDTKWHFLLDDLDCSMAHDSGNDVNLNCDLYSDTILGWIFKTLLCNEQFKREYFDRFEQLIQNDFSSENTIRLLDDLADEIREPIKLNINKWGAPESDTYWQEQIDIIRTYLMERAEYQEKYNLELEEYYETLILNE